MSVRADKRNESNVQFLVDLLNLNITIEKLMRKNAKGQDDIYKRAIINASIAAYREARCANGIMITETEPRAAYNYRREHFNNAKNYLATLASVLDIYLISTEEDGKVNSKKLMKKIERIDNAIYPIISAITKIMKYDTTKFKKIMASNKNVIVDMSTYCSDCDQKTIFLKDIREEINKSVDKSVKKINRLNRKSYITAVEYKFGLMYNDNVGNTIIKPVVFLPKETIESFDDGDPGYLKDIIGSTYTQESYSIDDEGEVRIVCPSHLVFSDNTPLF